MATGITVKITGDQIYQKALVGLSPRLNKKIARLGLRAVGFEVANYAKFKAIKRLNKTSKVLPRKLTSRTNVAVDDIHMQDQGLPRYVEVGSTKEYMRMHQEGTKFLKVRPWLEDSRDAIVPKKSEEIVHRFWEQQVRGAL